MSLLLLKLSYTNYFNDERFLKISEIIYFSVILQFARDKYFNCLKKGIIDTKPEIEISVNWFLPSWISCKWDYIARNGKLYNKHSSFNMLLLISKSISFLYLL